MPVTTLQIRAAADGLIAAMNLKTRQTVRLTPGEVKLYHLMLEMAYFTMRRITKAIDKL